MRIDSFGPYYTYTVFGDKWVEMAWCNDAMTFALHFLRSTTLEVLNLSELMDRHLEPEITRALCYGAMRARSPLNVATFVDMYEPDAGRFAVSLGLSPGAYFPSVRIQEQVQFGELDESYPEVIQDAPTGGGLDMGAQYRMLKKLGYTVEEIGRMTWDGMTGAIGAS